MFVRIEDLEEELETLVLHTIYPHDSLLLQSERSFAARVPKVVHTEELNVIEVLLLRVIIAKVAKAIQVLGQVSSMLTHDILLDGILVLLANRHHGTDLECIVDAILVPLPSEPLDEPQLVELRMLVEPDTDHTSTWHSGLDSESVVELVASDQAVVVALRTGSDSMMAQVEVVG